MLEHIADSTEFPAATSNKHNSVMNCLKTGLHKYTHAKNLTSRKFHATLYCHRYLGEGGESSYLVTVPNFL